MAVKTRARSSSPSTARGAGAARIVSHLSDLHAAPAPLAAG
ncbi:MAG: hypothetical protein ACLGJB_20940 [Blastocatellia bacterium]